MATSKLYTAVEVSSLNSKAAFISGKFLEISLVSASGRIPFAVPVIADEFQEGKGQIYIHTPEKDAGVNLEEFGARSVNITFEKLVDTTDSSTRFKLTMSVDGISSSGSQRTLGNLTEEVAAINGDTNFVVEFLEAEPFLSYAVKIVIDAIK